MPPCLISPWILIAFWLSRLAHGGVVTHDGMHGFLPQMLIFSPSLLRIPGLSTGHTLITLLEKRWNC